jgi:hypothetical protein
MFLIIVPDNKRYYEYNLKFHNFKHEILLINLDNGLINYMNNILFLLKNKKKYVKIIDVGGRFFYLSYFINSVSLINSFPLYELFGDFGKLYLFNFFPIIYYIKKSIIYILIELFSKQIAIQSDGLSSRLIFRKNFYIISHILNDFKFCNNPIKQIVLCGQVSKPKGLLYLKDIINLSNEYNLKIIIIGKIYKYDIKFFDLCKGNIQLFYLEDINNFNFEGSLLLHLSTFDSSSRCVFNFLNNHCFVLAFDHPGLSEIKNHIGLKLINKQIYSYNLLKDTFNKITNNDNSFVYENTNYENIRHKNIQSILNY